MEMRTFEKLGVKTSLLGFGTMRFPTKPDGKIDRDAAEEMLDKAYACGVNYFDTAVPYHAKESEEFVGKILNKYDRNTYFLATKLPPWDLSCEADVERVFNEQLKRLDKDYIDFYLLHNMNKDHWDIVQKFNAIPFLERMKAEGKIRFLGFSLHDDYETFEKILKYRDWDFCQLQYNYIDEDEQAGTKGYLLTEKLDIPLIVMEPVRGGSLANLSDDITNSFKKVNPTASTASFALRWVADHKNVKVILSGMSSKEQVDDNLDTFCNYKPLNDDERKAIANAAEIINQRVGNKCTGCRYCMPCPKGVNIPGSFGLWNRFKSFGSYENCRYGWERMKPEEKPENCVECGLCEKSCPQQINIRRDLKLAQGELDSQK